MTEAIIDASGFQYPGATIMSAVELSNTIKDPRKQELFQNSLANGVQGLYRVAAMMIMFDQLPRSKTPDIKNCKKSDMAFRLRLFEEERKEMYAALGIRVENTYAVRDDKIMPNYEHLFTDGELDGAVAASDQTQWDIVEFADGIGDIKVILNGTAFRFAIPQDLVDWEIHCSNMTKFGEGGTVIRREDGKILKGENYVKPDIARIMGLSDGVLESPVESSGSETSDEIKDGPAET